MIQQQDIYIQVSEYRITLFNSLLERTLVWRNNAYVPDVATNILTGISWTTFPNECLFDFGAPTAKAWTETQGDGQASATVTISYPNGVTLETVYTVFSKTPFIRHTTRLKGNLSALPDSLAIDTFSPTSRCLTLTNLSDMPEGAKHAAIRLAPNETHGVCGRRFLLTDEAFPNVAILLDANAPGDNGIRLAANGTRSLNILAGVPKKNDDDIWHTLGTVTLGLATPETILDAYRDFTACR